MWCPVLAFKLPLLEPYLLPTANKSRHGLNFAYSGATAAPAGFHGQKYFLGYQVDDFVRLKSLALEAEQQESPGEFLGAAANECLRVSIQFS